MQLRRENLERALAAVAVVAGALVALSTLGRGAWLDEFWTLMATRPSLTGAGFIEQMARDVHPILHYCIVYLAQSWGINDVLGVRLLNLLGLIPLGLGLWRACSNRALSGAQFCVLAAIAATSPMLLSNFAEARAYFMLFCAAIATTLMWVVIVQALEAKRKVAAVDLIVWGFVLFVFVNLHYFATLFGGLLTAVLIWRAWAQHEKTQAFILAGVSALAALPAVLVFALQTLSDDANIIGWIGTGRIDVIYVMARAIWEGGGGNLAAFACAIIALFHIADARERWRTARVELLLIGVIALYAAILVILNALQPLVIDRYLTAMGGAVCVALALLAGRYIGVKWAVSAICVWAILLSFRAWHSDLYAREGWRESATAVRALTESCASTKVYIDPSAGTPGMVDFNAARRLGFTYYAERMGFAVEEIGEGVHLPAPGACPNVIWLEHVDNFAATESAALLDRLNISAEGHGEVLAIGEKAALIVLR
jgi:hypothetical protein